MTIRLALALAATLLAVAAGCDTPSASDGDCFGSTPVCNVGKCDCAAEGTCTCTAACASDADCAADFTCSAGRFCVVRDGATDPDCR